MVFLVSPLPASGIVFEVISSVFSRHRCYVECIKALSREHITTATPTQPLRIAVKGSVHACAAHTVFIAVCSSCVMDASVNSDGKGLQRIRTLTMIEVRYASLNKSWPNEPLYC
jgi:hypothetical protein